MDHDFNIILRQVQNLITLDFINNEISEHAWIVWLSGESLHLCTD